MVSDKNQNKKAGEEDTDTAVLRKVLTVRKILRVKNSEDQGVSAGAVARDRGRKGKEKTALGEGLRTVAMK